MDDDDDTYEKIAKVFFNIHSEIILIIYFTNVEYKVLQNE